VDIAPRCASADANDEWGAAQFGARRGGGRLKLLHRRLQAVRNQHANGILRRRVLHQHRNEHRRRQHYAALLHGCESLANCLQKYHTIFTASFHIIG
jgi:hypothetical protein